MNEHSNLFWEIQMTFGASDDPPYCQRTGVDVRDYDYAHTFDTARRIYEVQTTTLKNKLYCFDMYLRFNETGDDDHKAFEIVKHWGLKYGTKSADEFFENQAHSFEALYLH